MSVEAADLLSVGSTPGDVTPAGVQLNVSVALQYLTAWLRGNGAVGINNLMEDTATAEISRSQLWQWLRHGVEIEGIGPFSKDMYRGIREVEFERLKPVLANGDGRFREAAQMLDALVLSDRCEGFLTLAAIDRL